MKENKEFNDRVSLLEINNATPRSLSNAELTNYAQKSNDTQKSNHTGKNYKSAAQQLPCIVTNLSKL